jgi:uncharacterized protein (DUF736 family)
MDIKENTGVLFKNDRKTEKQPAYRGEINVDGKHWAIALWDRKSSKGTTYLSVAIQEFRDVKNEPKEEVVMQADKPHKETALNSYPDMDDEIPF